MAIGWKCRDCGHDFRVADRHAGKKVACPRCGSVDTEPQSSNGAPAKKAEGKAAPLPKSLRAEAPKLPKARPLSAGKSERGKSDRNSAGKPGTKSGPPGNRQASRNGDSGVFPTVAPDPAEIPVGRVSDDDLPTMPVAAPPDVELPTMPVASRNGGPEEPLPTMPVATPPGPTAAAAPAGRQLPRFPGLAPAPASGGNPNAEGGDSPSPMIYLILGGVLALLALGGGAMYLLNRGSGEPKVAENAEPQEPSAAADARPRQATRKPPAVRGGEEEPTDEPDFDADVAARLAETVGPSLCRLEIVRGLTRTVHAGFLIDERGWVATTYNVIDGADSGEIVFGDERQPVAGVVTYDRSRGLAILKAASIPSGLQPLKLVDASPTEETTLYRPKPDGTGFEGSRVQAHLTVATLPASIRVSLGGELRDGEDVDWLQMSAAVAKSGSGVPLFTADGHVAGLQHWLSAARNEGYAISGRHLADVAAKGTSDVIPLAPKLADLNAVPEPEDFDPASPNPNPDPSPGIPEPGPGGESTDPPKPEIDPAGDSVQQLEALIAANEKLGWKASTLDEYYTLHRFATVLTEVAEEIDAEGTPADRQQACEQALDAALMAVEKQEFDLATIRAHNEVAVKNLEDPGKGVFIYCSTASAPLQLGPKKAVVLTVTGSEAMLIAPVSTGLDQLKQGQDFLVIGVHTVGDVTVNMDGRATAAKLVSAKFLIEKVREGE